jgi:transposase-like protein
VIRRSRPVSASFAGDRFPPEVILLAVRWYLRRAFVRNLRRGHYELGVEARHERLRLAAAFDELTTAI